MAETKLQVWVNESDLHCSVCHDALYYAVTLPCMHRYCEKCVFHLDKCALCREEIDYSVAPKPDHFFQTLARDNIKELPLCGQAPSLLYAEHQEHRKQCLTCLQTLCVKQEETLRSTRTRCYRLLSNDDDDSDDDSDDGNLNPRIRFNVVRR